MKARARSKSAVSIPAFRSAMAAESPPIPAPITIDLKEIGAGLSLAANATKALNGLGLTDALRGIGVPIRVAEIRTWRG